MFISVRNKPLNSLIFTAACDIFFFFFFFFFVVVFLLLFFFSEKIRLVILFESSATEVSSLIFSKGINSRLLQFC